jgi:hypothetical protein
MNVKISIIISGNRKVFVYPSVFRNDIWLITDVAPLFEVVELRSYSSSSAVSPEGDVNQHRETELFSEIGINIVGAAFYDKRFETMKPWRCVAEGNCERIASSKRSDFVIMEIG